jgi:hypothetical protein
MNKNEVVQIIDQCNYNIEEVEETENCMDHGCSYDRINYSIVWCCRL